MGVPDGLEERLGLIEAAIAKSRRYATVTPVTVRRVAQTALTSSRGDVSEAIKRTKRGLHEIYGAYLPGNEPNYPAMLRKLRAATASGDHQTVLDALSSCMAAHSSTRERLPYLTSFYEEIFSRVPAPATVRDLACGLNPLAVPWMRLPPSAVYLASDIGGRLVEFIGEALSELHVAHQAELLDMIDRPPTEYADLTLLLKTVPCLERQQSGAGWALIEKVNSPTVVVTFPTKSLGQRSKGMFQTYSAAFEEYMSGRPWQAERMEIPNELIYIVRKQPEGAGHR
jgi:16S rRNA (guanine(1405)-N(7))-methyltransferase